MSQHGIARSQLLGLLALASSAILLLLFFLFRGLFGFNRGQFEGVRKIIYGDVSLEEYVAGIQESSRDDLFKQALSLLDADKARAAASLLAENESQQTADSQHDYWILLGYAYEKSTQRDLARQSIHELFSLENMEYDEQARIDIAAWRFLRDLGEPPGDGQEHRLLGLATNTNVDGVETLVAGYADGNSRLLSEQGVGVIGGKEFFPDEAVRLAKKLVEVSGPLAVAFHNENSLHYTERPRTGGVSITFLTPSGSNTVMVENVQLLEDEAHQLHGLWTVRNQLYDVLLSFYHNG